MCTFILNTMLVTVSFVTTLSRLYTIFVSIPLYVSRCPILLLLLLCKAQDAEYHDAAVDGGWDTEVTLMVPQLSLALFLIQDIILHFIRL